jgi:hypothetical protein
MITFHVFFLHQVKFDDLEEDAEIYACPSWSIRSLRKMKECLHQPLRKDLPAFPVYEIQRFL